jgi:hypothetical protein
MRVASCCREWLGDATFGGWWPRLVAARDDCWRRGFAHGSRMDEVSRVNLRHEPPALLPAVARVDRRPEFGTSPILVSSPAVRAWSRSVPTDGSCEGGVANEASSVRLTVGLLAGRNADRFLML